MTHAREIRSLAGYLYVHGLVNEDMPSLDILAQSAKVKECIDKLVTDLESASDDLTEDELQSIFYEAGKLHFLTELRWWFKVLYVVLFGRQDGPRLGQFTKIMSIDWVIHKLPDCMPDYAVQFREERARRIAINDW